MPQKICIVTPGYISQTPRVVREADALAASGYDVRVAFTQGQLHPIREFDDALLRGKRWRSSAHRWSNRMPGEWLAFHRSRVRHRAARLLASKTTAVPGLVERAEGRVFPELASIAAEEPADLYIGHYPIGLAAACVAARRHAALVGYDLEDLYADTEMPGPDWADSRARILHIESRYVERCAHLSAVSVPVANAFAERHRCRVPVVIRNCHPWSDRESVDNRILQRRGSGLSLYWFSQTVGLDRGLQDAIRAMGHVPHRVQLHLQGHADEAIRSALSALAGECGVADRIHFHAPVPPGDLLSRASEHDVGLALEPGDSLNRQLTITNKILMYYTAGLAIVATDLPGQRTVFDECPDTGGMFAAGDTAAMASLLDCWSRNPARLSQAKRASLEAARTRLNWERESRGLVDAVDRLFAGRRRSLRETDDQRAAAAV